MTWRAAERELGAQLVLRLAARTTWVLVTEFGGQVSTTCRDPARLVLPNLTARR